MQVLLIHFFSPSFPPSFYGLVFSFLLSLACFNDHSARLSTTDLHILFFFFHLLLPLSRRSPPLLFLFLTTIFSSRFLSYLLCLCVCVCFTHATASYILQKKKSVFFSSHGSFSSSSVVHSQPRPCLGSTAEAGGADAREQLSSAPTTTAAAPNGSHQHLRTARRTGWRWRLWHARHDGCRSGW